ncbi:MAG: hypothetical protein B7Z08_09670 [Sphingomonadales bacterium 32-68-7]|nr:MAG: hypothetical protein B7Z33_06730 [Sphingomonadales bacterium 12-68-11]OYX08440.1 MAG: hypothetical protein B7Z08_09670 [Sphingomonadales bacterium 32-68-7]
MLTLAACDSSPNGQAGGEATAAAVSSASAAASASASASASIGPDGARSLSEETDEFLFSYAYPAAAGNIPELAALLDRRLEQSRGALVQEAAEARRAARADGFPYNKHSVETRWEVVTDLPGWLSLSAEIESYGGGAHGNYGFDSLVWDKQGARALPAIDLFASAEALDEAIGETMCRALNAERAKRRGEPVPEGSDDQFDQCVGVAETTVLVGSAGRRKFDRIGVQIGPYVAGPYAEGAFELSFPVNRAVLAAVKPEFRDAFVARN